MVYKGRWNKISELVKGLIVTFYYHSASLNISHNAFASGNFMTQNAPASCVPAKDDVSLEK